MSDNESMENLSEKKKKKNVTLTNSPDQLQNVERGQETQG